MSGRCCACGASGLVAHLRVRGEAGPQGLIPTTDRYGVALDDIVRCPACGHGQLARMPDAPELDAAYGEAASDDYLAEEAGQRATARQALASIERHAGRPLREAALLDLGCWVGFLLTEAQARGWEAVGVEPSAWAAARARERGAEVLETGLLEAGLEPGRFAAVAMGDVIEHLPDPGAALDMIAGWLAPGGVLWLALPDAGSALARAMGRRWWSVLPTHVQYFTRDSLRRLLERHGYTVLDVRTAPKAFTVRYYLERLGGYSPALARRAVAAAEAARVADRLWAPDFRDRMAVVARAPR